MVGVSASVVFPCAIKSRRRFFSGTGSPGWSRKQGSKTVVCVQISAVSSYLISVNMRKIYFSCGIQYVVDVVAAAVAMAM